jgi:hypothetical protein
MPNFRFAIRCLICYNYSLKTGIAMNTETSNFLVVMPAYGRSYATSEQVIADWKSGKDFKVVNGPYCSIRDLDYLDCDAVWVDLVTTLVRVE